MMRRRNKVFKINSQGQESSFLPFFIFFPESAYGSPVLQSSKIFFVSEMKNVSFVNRDYLLLLA